MKTILDIINEDSVSIEEQVKIWNEVYDNFETYMLDNNGVEISDDSAGYARFLKPGTKVKPLDKSDHLSYGMYMFMMDPTTMEGSDVKKFINKQKRILKKAGIPCVQHDDDLCVTHPLFREWFMPIYQKGMNDENMTAAEKKAYAAYEDICYSYM